MILLTISHRSRWCQGAPNNIRELSLFRVSGLSRPIEFVVYLGEELTGGDDFPRSTAVGIVLLLSPLASEDSEGKATPESRCGRRTRPLPRCLGLLAELPLGGLTVLRARLNTCPAHRENRASCLLASRSHRTKLATAVQRSQSPKLRVTVPKAGCINGA